MPKSDAKKCSVNGCETSNLQYFRFPEPEKEKDRRDEWFRRCGVKDELQKVKLYACSHHFSEKMGFVKLLKRDALPDINLPKNDYNLKIRELKNDESYIHLIGEPMESIKVGFPVFCCEMEMQAQIDELKIKLSQKKKQRQILKMHNELLIQEIHRIKTHKVD